MNRVCRLAIGCALLFGACSNKEPEMAVVVGVAATLQAVQLAREAKADAQVPTTECCVVCDPCTFPCGDSCVPNGSLCSAPRGCACWQLPEGERKIHDRPPEPEGGCPQGWFPLVVE
jgi:hypothetical protein